VAFYVPRRQQSNSFIYSSFKFLKMKKLLVAIAVMAFIGTGCSSNPNQEAAHEHGADTHVHEGEAAHDESVPHEHAESNETTAPNQEEFTVGEDTTSVKKAPEKHSQDGKTEHVH
jgi:hypothetical protein